MTEAIRVINSCDGEIPRAAPIPNLVVDGDKNVLIIKPMIGLCYMQVCAKKGLSDEVILDVCNIENPSGTTNGWGRVIRESENEREDDLLPVGCGADYRREHLVIAC